MTEPLTLTSRYMDMAFDTPESHAERFRTRLAADPENARYDADTLVGTGLSGALVVPGLARALGLHWLIVRKPGDDSHSGSPVEGTLGARWLFVDDFIDSGETYWRVRHAVEGLCVERGHTSEHVGSYCYQRWGFEPPMRGGNPYTDLPEPRALNTAILPELTARLNAAVNSAFVLGVQPNVTLNPGDTVTISQTIKMPANHLTSS